MKIAQIRRRMFACLLGLTLLCPTGVLATEPTTEVPVAQSEAVQTVRVQLTKIGVTDRMDATLNGSYSAEFAQTSLVFGRGSDITLLLKDGRMVLYYMGLSVDAGTELTLARHPDMLASENGIRFANNLSVYEGDLRITVQEDRMLLMLTVGLEDYLKGVVPYEMSDTFPLEALKAQAVAARTYAVSKVQMNAEQAYDLVDNTNDQVYKGRREEYTQAALAVDETSGICGFYKGQLAMCYYSASNGGQTELAQDVWDSSGDYGYLDMRDDPYDVENPQSKVQTVTLPKMSTAVTDTPYVLRWLLSQQLAETLTAGGYDPAPESLRVDKVTAVTVDTPKFDAPSRLYTMLHITFAYSARVRTNGVAPNTTQWTDDDVEVSLFTPIPTPSLVVMPTAEATFADNTPIPTPSPTPAPSYGPFEGTGELITLDIPLFPTAEKALSLGINSYDNEMITVTEQTDTFTIESRRFGHGVGLSQRGAEWMAGKYAKTYTEILAFYYPGMQLMRFPETEVALPVLAQALTETAGPIPTPTPRPTLMPVTQTLPTGAWYATVTGIDDDSSLNLRASPDASAEVLMRLYKNQQLIVLEKCPQEGWVRVSTDAVVGYVMEKFLTQDLV